MSDTTDPVAEDQRLADLEAELVLRKQERRLARSKDPKTKREVREARLHYRAARDGLVVVEDKKGRHVALTKAQAKGLKRVEAPS
jgi:hypothetical protein